MVLVQLLDYLVEKAGISGLSVKNTTIKPKVISIKINETKLFTKCGAPLESDGLYYM